MFQKSIFAKLVEINILVQGLDDEGYFAWATCLPFFFPSQVMASSVAGYFLILIMINKSDFTLVYEWKGDRFYKQHRKMHQHEACACFMPKHALLVGSIHIITFVK